MKKKVILIDDESSARMLLRQYISGHEQFEIIAECDNGIEAVDLINRHEPHLIFLDIKMPGLNGIQVVQELIHVPQIIFTTAYDQYALKAFDSNAIDYLLKPYTADRFNKAVAKISRNFTAIDGRIQQGAEEGSSQKYPSRMLVESGHKFISLDVKDIVYIEAEKDYCKIHTDAKSYLSSHGIGVLEQKMNPVLFLRVHRSFIVNVEQVKEFHREGSHAQIILKNNIPLNVSRTYIDELKKLMI